MRNLKKIQIDFQQTIFEKSPFKRIVQNQKPGTYRYLVIEAWNELVTLLRDPNYHKPKHILIEGPAGLGKTQFLNKIIGIHNLVSDFVVFSFFYEKHEPYRELVGTAAKPKADSG